MEKFAVDKITFQANTTWLGARWFDREHTSYCCC